MSNMFQVIYRNGLEINTSNKDLIAEDVKNIKSCRITNGPLIIANGKLTESGKYVIYDTAHIYSNQ